MKKIFSCFILVLLSIPILGQIALNMELLGQVHPNEPLNDVWGYVDPNTSIEYAVLGTEYAVIIYSLEDPGAPEEIIYIPGSFSTWRDMKSFQTTIYGVTDLVSDGVLIIDMSDISSIVHSFWKPDIPLQDTSRVLQFCHNIYIDTDQGLAFLSGCNAGGIIIFDLNNNPLVPDYISSINRTYSHDNFARGNRLYSADINDGVFTIYDISDPQNPALLTSQRTTFNYTHNIWPSDDGNFVFTTDEESFGFVDAYDISDLDNIQLVDQYRPPLATQNGSIPHNTHYYNGYLLTSWYTEGIRIIDAHQPDNLVEVGFYDTSTGYKNGFHGCWGAFPFFPSGICLASDSENGLFVLRPNYLRACYLEGSVFNAVTNDPVNNVDIEIVGREIKELSNPNGTFKTGYSTPGNYKVAFSKTGYFPDTIEVELIAGEIQRLDLDLIPIATFSGKVLRSDNGEAIPNANIIIIDDITDLFFETTSDGQGQFIMPTFVPGDYQIIAGKWGFFHKASQMNINANANITIVLDPGYQDDFLFNFNWQVSGDAAQGHWEQSKPKGISFNGGYSNPNKDVDFDFGKEAYITGNQGIQLLDDDVDFGTTRLSSPKMDLANYVNPQMHFSYWFYNRIQANIAEDTLKVLLSSGEDTVLVNQIVKSDPNWLQDSFLVAEYIDLSDSIQIHFSTQEIKHESLIEAGIDAFLVTEGLNTSTNTISTISGEWNVQPNPFSDGFVIEHLHPISEAVVVQVYNTLGQLIETEMFNENNMSKMLGQNWNNGVYIVRISNANNQQECIKVIKQ